MFHRNSLVYFEIILDENQDLTCDIIAILTNYLTHSNLMYQKKFMNKKKLLAIRIYCILFTFCLFLYFI